jgi:hypothetical protein
MQELKELVVMHSFSGPGDFFVHLGGNSHFEGKISCHKDILLPAFEILSNTTLISEDSVDLTQWDGDAALYAILSAYGSIKSNETSFSDTLLLMEADTVVCYLDPSEKSYISRAIRSKLTKHLSSRIMPEKITRNISHRHGFQCLGMRTDDRTDQLKVFDEMYHTRTDAKMLGYYLLDEKTLSAYKNLDLTFFDDIQTNIEENDDRMFQHRSETSEQYDQTTERHTQVISACIVVLSWCTSHLIRERNRQYIVRTPKLIYNRMLYSNWFDDHIVTLDNQGHFVDAKYGNELLFPVYAILPIFLRLTSVLCPILPHRLSESVMNAWISSDISVVKALVSCLTVHRNIRRNNFASSFILMYVLIWADADATKLRTILKFMAEHPVGLSHYHMQWIPMMYTVFDPTDSLPGSFKRFVKYVNLFCSREDRATLVYHRVGDLEKAWLKAGEYRKKLSTKK